MDLNKEPSIEPDLKNSSLTLREYAQANILTENQVWERIEEGSLSARFLNDNIFVFEENKSPCGLAGIEINPNDIHSFDASISQTQVIHNSISLLENLLKSKDEIMQLKDQKIGFLEQKIRSLEEQLLQTKRELENYATLHKITKNPTILRTLIQD